MPGRRPPTPCPPARSLLPAPPRSPRSSGRPPSRPGASRERVRGSSRRPPQPGRQQRQGLRLRAEQRRRQRDRDRPGDDDRSSTTSTPASWSSTSCRAGTCQTLYANASGASRLVPIDPRTGKPGTPISVDAPYNLYFTPDGTQAVVMAERRDRIDFYDPHTWTLPSSIRAVRARASTTPTGPWTAAGSWSPASSRGRSSSSTRRSGDARSGVLDLPPGSMPQDLRLTPTATRST